MIAFLLAAALQDDDWYRLRVTVVTDSDWTAVKFANAPRFWVDDQTVTTAQKTKVSSGPLSVNKASYDATETTIEAVVFTQLPAKGDLEIVVTRGSIGKTKVTIRDVGEIVHDTTTGEGTNRRTFAVLRDKIVRTGKARFEKKKPREKLALAFYYPWYGKGIHWGEGITNQPELGHYDSQDEAVIRKHIAWAKEAKLDGFIASWWGRGGFEDKATRKLVEIAEKEKFLVSAYYEVEKEGDLDYLVKEYGKSPAWLKVDGKPVIFVYCRVVNEVQPFRRDDAVLIMDTFDVRYGKAGGLHTYNPVFNDLAELRDQYRSASFACAANGLVFAATVVPGYDDTHVRKPGGKRDRDGGKLYDEFWKAAIAAEPDWILVCSWNEWHEGSDIEPSKEFGDAYLKRTADWVGRWKK